MDGSWSVALVFRMAVVGGITRLTHSGLSIVEWQPIVDCAVNLRPSRVAITSSCTEVKRNSEPLVFRGEIVHTKDLARAPLPRVSSRASQPFIRLVARRLQFQHYVAELDINIFMSY